MSGRTHSVDSTAIITNCGDEGAPVIALDDVFIAVEDNEFCTLLDSSVSRETRTLAMQRRFRTAHPGTLRSDKSH